MLVLGPLRGPAGINPLATDKSPRRKSSFQDWDCGLLAAIDATAGAGLMDADGAEFRQQRLEFVPDPLGEDFAGGVFQARNIVEVVVVQALVERLEDRLDFREVTNPASVRVDLAAQVNRNLERVTVQAAAFVAVRYVGQAMGGFEGELFENFQGKGSLR